MKILHTVAGLWRGTGGPAESVPALCAALAKRGHEVTLLTGEGDTAPSVELIAPLVRVVRVRIGPYWLGHFSREFRSEVKRLALEVSLVHTHGLWLYPNLATAWVGEKLAKPVVVSPRGMLSEWALAQGATRKKLAWKVAQARAINSADLVHVTSAREEEEVRTAGVISPIGIIPNGIDVDRFPTRKGASDEGAIVLFLSRIHEKKGLDLLLEAWRRVEMRHPKARLVIAGDGEAAEVDRLRRAISRMLSQSVRYVGPVYGVTKRKLLQEASLFVLPSRSENYGMAIAEALASELPVLTTTSVPWDELPAIGCGWCVEPTVEPIAEALSQALDTAPQVLLEMGRRGRRYVAEQHSIEATGRRMQAAYEWVLKQVDQPDFVHTGISR